MVLFIDNKAVIQTISWLHPHNGQKEALAVNDMIHRWILHNNDNLIEIVWVPSHSGFELNKHADKSMKTPFIGPVPLKIPSLSLTIKDNRAIAVLQWHAQFNVPNSSSLKRIRRLFCPALGTPPAITSYALWTTIWHLSVDLPELFPTMCPPENTGPGFSHYSQHLANADLPFIKTLQNLPNFYKIIWQHSPLKTLHLNWWIPRS